MFVGKRSIKETLEYIHREESEKMKHGAAQAFSWGNQSQAAGPPRRPARQRAGTAYGGTEEKSLVKKHKQPLTTVSEEQQYIRNEQQAVVTPNSARMKTISHRQMHSFGKYAEFFCS